MKILKMIHIKKKKIFLQEKKKKPPVALTVNMRATFTWFEVV